MTVAEVLDIAPLAARGRDGVDAMRALVADLFPRLRERRASKIRYLSGGERQMVSIAVGLMALPKLLILDEPTLGLSPKLRRRALREAIQKIRRRPASPCCWSIRMSSSCTVADRHGSILFDHGSHLARRSRRPKCPRTRTSWPCCSETAH